jgi:hypothetical protein
LQKYKKFKLHTLERVLMGSSLGINPLPGFLDKILQYSKGESILEQEKYLDKVALY